MEFAIGENVKFIANGKFDYGNESEVVKITKTQIHIKYKHRDAPANGTIMKFNAKTLEQISSSYYKNKIQKL